MKNKFGNVVANFDQSHQDASAETWAITGFGLVALVLFAAVLIHFA